MQLFKKGAKKVAKADRGSFTVIIAAAGSGERLGGVSKPLVPLCGKKMIEYSLEAFSGIDCVKNIVVSARSEDIPEYEKIVSQRGFTKVSAIVPGGSTRTESVKNAFCAAFSSLITQFVAIHDGARPLVDREDIEAVFSDTKKYGCAVLSSPVSDTVKRGGKSGFVTESVAREGLYGMQTPQCFSYEIYSASIAICQGSGEVFTDDSSMVQSAGFKVKLTPASHHNFKITYPSDIALAEAVIRTKVTK